MTDEQTKSLIEAAVAAGRFAYVPYSNYTVGAALLARDGTIYGGCNIENASYPVTLCAERTALAKAVSEGQREFEAIAVVTRDGGSPCGMCRQMLHELAPGVRVILANMAGVVHLDTTIDALLPHGFNAGSLKA